MSENISRGCSCPQGAGRACQTGCCSAPDYEVVYTSERQIVIDFLYLDLSACSRCQGTETALDEALTEIAHLLEAIGTEMVVNKVNVINQELARKHRFVSSPTVRVNGRDIQMEIRESQCESCGELCGDSIDCRVWVYQGKEYAVPPKAMLIDAILHEVFGPEGSEDEAAEYVMPDNLKRFYAAMEANAGDNC